MGDEPRPTRGDAVAAVVLPMILLFGVLMPIALLIWRGVTPDVVSRQADGGHFVAADATPGGFFAPTLTTVQTSTSSVTVAGPFSAPRGSHLVIRYMNQTGLHLCVAESRGSCVPLAGEWSGELQPTPATTHAFDFYACGLTSRALVGWLVIGIFLLFCGVIIWALNGEVDKP